MNHRIDRQDVRHLLGWPDSYAEVLPPALWLPAEVDDEPAMIETLSSAWGKFGWGGLQTWFSTSHQGFAERYGDLHLETVAESSFTSPGGRTARSEWATLNPSSPGLVAFLADLRSSGGKGTGLTIFRPEAGPRAWYAPTAALVQRALLAFQRPPQLDAATAEITTTAPYVTAPASAELAVVVPLTIHPWGGFAVLAKDEMLADLDATLPADVPGRAGVSPASVVEHAGGLAI